MVVLVWGSCGVWELHYGGVSVCGGHGESLCFQRFLSFPRFLHVPREKKISKKSLPLPNHLPLLILRGIWNRQRCQCCLGAVYIKFS